MRDSSPGPGTEDHTALWLDSSRSSRLSWQVPENGEVPNTTSQDTWLPGLLPTHLPDPFFFYLQRLWRGSACFGHCLRLRSAKSGPSEYVLERASVELIYRLMTPLGKSSSVVLHLCFLVTLQTFSASGLYVL